MSLSSLLGTRRLHEAWFSLVPIAIVLAFLPGWSFHYDVVPKAVALLAAAGSLCIYAALRPPVLTLLWTPGTARWNAMLGSAGILVATISTLFSPLVPLAWAGSEWRRMGALEFSAVIVAALLLSVHRAAVLRGLCVAGILAALYAIAQYFGWDPWLDPAGYHFGEGAFRIVRPPGPLGHSNYLAAFLLWPVFCGVDVWRTNRVLAAASIATATAAILLCGSRGALAGLIAGTAVLLIVARPRLRNIAPIVLIAALALGLFYVSPYGEPLRARVFWIGEDSAGGSRLLMWRDSLRMALDRPWTGFGSDAFATEFPLHQSAELSRKFPDFYHESPHNMFLDALTSHGILGLALWLAWIALGLYAGRRALRGPERPLAAGLLAALVASVIAHQFAVLVIPTAFAVLLGVALLANLDQPKLPATRVGFLRFSALAAAALFLFEARQLARADFALAKVQQADSAAAGDLWRATKNSGATANLALSRQWTVNATRTTNALEKLRWSQIAAEAAVAATQDLEQRQNAWYNLAILQASANVGAATEQSLREAIAAAPTWFKPHWALARLLAANGRDARDEARLALDLNGRRDPEVIATMEEILRSADDRK